MLETGGIDQEQIDEIELREEGREIGARLLDAECERPLRKLLAQFSNPVTQRIGFGRDLPVAPVGAAGVEEGDIDLAIGTVDADARRVILGNLRFVWIVHA